MNKSSSRLFPIEHISEWEVCTNRITNKKSDVFNLSSPKSFPANCHRLFVPFTEADGKMDPEGGLLN